MVSVAGLQGSRLECFFAKHELHQNSLQTVQMYVYRYIIPNLFFENAFLQISQRIRVTNGGTSNKLWAIAMVQLCPIALDPRCGVM